VDERPLDGPFAELEAPVRHAKVGVNLPVLANKIRVFRLQDRSDGVEIIAARFDFDVEMTHRI
jgi:hypothetical protein